MVRNIFKGVLSLLVVVCFSINIYAIDKPLDSFVYDETKVLSQATIDEINAINDSLKAGCKAEIAVVFINFLDNIMIDDFAYQTFNAWGIGDKERNNGVLYVVSLGDGEFYAVSGSGIEKVISGSVLLEIQEGEVLDYLNKADYDQAALTFVEKTSALLADYYDINLEDNQASNIVSDNNNHQGKANTGDNFMVMLIVAIMTIFILIILWSFIVGMTSRGRSYYRPHRVPRRYHPPHYRPGPNPMRSAPRPQMVRRPASIKSSRSSRSVSVSGRPSRSSSRSSRSFGGGSTRGGGAGGRFGKH